MKRCRHKNITITETGSWHTQHSRDDGEWTHNNEPGGYTSKLDVSCHDCGYERVHWKGERSMPAWIRDALQEIGL